MRTDCARKNTRGTVPAAAVLAARANIAARAKAMAKAMAAIKPRCKNGCRNSDDHTHIADLEAFKPLTDALYAVFDGNQKERANKVLMKRGH